MSGLLSKCQIQTPAKKDKTQCQADKSPICAGMSRASVIKSIVRWKALALANLSPVIKL